MAQATRTFRIFVSSTFSDLKEERNALQRHVFPRLREPCARHGCRFQAIDLRWGVREEAALDQQTMRICLEEIARCQRVTPRPSLVLDFRAVQLEPYPRSTDGHTGAITLDSGRRSAVCR